MPNIESRTIGQMTSFGAKASKKRAKAGSVTLQGNAGSGFVTIPSDQYKILNRTGYIVQRDLDDSNNPVDWSTYDPNTGGSGWQVAYTVRVGGVDTVVPYEAITFADEAVQVASGEGALSAELTNDADVQDDDVVTLSGWDSQVGVLVADNGNVKLNSVTPAISLGAASAFGTGVGIWQGKDSGTYKWRVGDPAANRAQWDGSTFTVVGTITASAGTIGGFTIGATTLTATNLVLDSANQKIVLGTGTDVITLDAADATYRIAVGHSTYSSAPFRVTKAGAVTATSGTIGGWTLGTSTLTSGSITLNSATPKITLGAVTDYLNATGIFMGLSGAAYKFSVGTTSKYFAFDGTNPTASGNWIDNQGVETSLQTWKTSVVFSSASATQVNWTSGTIQLADGRTFSISSGNTGTMSALNYIYLDTAVSSTVLQKTTTYSTAVGSGKVLIAAAQNNATGASVIPFSGQQPIIDGGAQIIASSITAGSIAAGAITAAKISVSQLSAIAADMGSITAGTITGATIRTASSGARVEMNSSNFKLTDATTNVLLLDTNGLRILLPTTADSLHSIRFRDAGDTTDAMAWNGFYDATAGTTSTLQINGTQSAYLYINAVSSVSAGLDEAQVSVQASHLGTKIAFIRPYANSTVEQVQARGALIWITDNTHDIGASGATRPRNLFLAGSATLGGGITLADAQNFSFGTSTGTKIGTATSQKIGFFNTTPVVQQTNSITGTARTGGGGTTLTTSDTWGGFTIAQLFKAMFNLGLIA